MMAMQYKAKGTSGIFQILQSSCQCSPRQITTLYMPYALCTTYTYKPRNPLLNKLESPHVQRMNRYENLSHLDSTDPVLHVLGFGID